MTRRRPIDVLQHARVLPVRVHLLMLLLLLLLLLLMLLVSDLVRVVGVLLLLLLLLVIRRLHGAIFGGAAVGPAAEGLGQASGAAEASRRGHLRATTREQVAVLEKAATARLVRAAGHGQAVRVRLLRVVRLRRLGANALLQFEY